MGEARPAEGTERSLALRWWDATDYLTMAQICLRANLLLREQREHLEDLPEARNWS
jgi:hypothetical protein